MSNIFANIFLDCFVQDWVLTACADKTESKAGALNHIILIMNNGFVLFQCATWVLYKFLWCRLHSVRLTANLTLTLHPGFQLLPLLLVKAPRRNQQQRDVQYTVCVDLTAWFSSLDTLTEQGEQGWSSGESTCFPPVWEATTAAPRGFSLITSVFPSPKKTTADFYFIWFKVSSFSRAHPCAWVRKIPHSPLLAVCKRYMFDLKLSLKDNILIYLASNKIMPRALWSFHVYWAPYRNYAIV